MRGMGASIIVKWEGIRIKWLNYAICEVILMRPAADSVRYVGLLAVIAVSRRYTQEPHIFIA